MPKGGARNGAGRKPILPDLDTRAIRGLIRTEDLINELQSIVFQNKGKPTTSERINAIRTLLNKAIPDLQAMRITDDRDKSSSQWKG